ncbi:MAG: MGMT family protein [Granulosicoccus sp.]
MNYISPPDKQAYWEAVWAFVRKLPSGKVATYGQIMKALPKPVGTSEEDYRMSASRWVGAAMAACPDEVPWHRVINSQGKISHQTGAEEQRKRLLSEGVLFSKDRVDLTLFQWRESGQLEEPMQPQLF